MMTQTVPQSEETADLRSVHSSNLPELFDRLGISLIVSTYEAGKAIIRNGSGKLNTHFRILLDLNRWVSNFRFGQTRKELS
jgi:hypothetical protein